jgi:hypothetical protein
MSPVRQPPDGCGCADRGSGPGIGSVVRIAGLEFAVEGLDQGDTAPWFK